MADNYNTGGWESALSLTATPPCCAKWRTQHRRSSSARTSNTTTCTVSTIRNLLNLAIKFISLCRAQEIKSPLLEVFQKPKSIIILKDRFQEDLTNQWNEFISNYDPMEKPELLKNGTTIFQFFAIQLITAVSIVKELKKGYGIVKKDFFSRLKFFTTTVRREMRKRQITMKNFINSFMTLFDPRTNLKFLASVWYSGVSYVIKLPFKLYQEFRALHSCATQQYCKYPGTFVELIYSYVPLAFYACGEVFYWAKLLVEAPQTIWNQVVSPAETVQTIPPCGRKVVAWSEPVNTEFIQKVSCKFTLVNNF